MDVLRYSVTFNSFKAGGLATMAPGALPKREILP
jgi:hypothetical protein